MVIDGCAVYTDLHCEALNHLPDFLFSHLVAYYESYTGEALLM